MSDQDQWSWVLIKEGKGVDSCPDLLESVDFLELKFTKPVSLKMKKRSSPSLFFDNFTLLFLVS